MSNSSDEVKLTFRLSAVQAGPFPVATESIWCRRESEGYRLKNAPFFIDGVSFDDLVSVKFFDDSTAEIIETIQRSGNSTLWIYVKDREAAGDLISNLLGVGCGVESGVIDELYSVNVPKRISIDQVFAILDPAKESGAILLDYPSLQHSPREEE